MNAVVSEIDPIICISKLRIISIEFNRESKSITIDNFCITEAVECTYDMCIHQDSWIWVIMERQVQD
jgi:hypothetical protein